MRSPFLKTYAALVVLLGLGAYIYFVESKRPSEKAKEKVFSLDKGKVAELSLEKAGGAAIRVIKDGSTWKMTSPKPVAADQDAVSSLLDTLASLEVDQVVVEGSTDLKQYGLASPRFTVEARLKGAKEPLKLLVGDKVPTGGGLYAMVPTRARVFTIASYLESSLDKKPFDFRDRNLLHVKRDAVRKLEVTGPEGRYALERKGEGNWVFTRPLETRAGRWKVDGLLGTLEGLKMDSVAAEEAKSLKPFGLDKPARTVALGLADGSTKTLSIGSSPEKDKYDAAISGSSLVAVIPKALVEQLAKGMDDLRAKRLLDVAAYEVKGFDLTADGATRSFSRTKTKGKAGAETSKWKITSPKAKDLDTDKVQDALFKIGGVDVTSFVDHPGPPAGYGLDAPAFKLALKYDSGKPDDSVEIGRKDDTYYARRPGDQSVLELDKKKTEELLKAFKEL